MLIPMMRRNLIVRFFIKIIPKTVTNIEDGKQVVRSSGSVGANYIESVERSGFIKDVGGVTRSNKFLNRTAIIEFEAGYRKVVRSIYSFDAIFRKLNYFWKNDFWYHSNKINPVKFKYRLIFSLRLFSLLFSSNTKRSLFILRIMPRVLFDKKVRISTILTIMAYNDFAYSI